MKTISQLSLFALAGLLVGLVPAPANAARKKHRAPHKKVHAKAKPAAAKPKAPVKPAATAPKLSASTGPNTASLNRIALYIQASRAITAANPPVDPVEDPQTPQDPAARAERYSLARKDAWLKENVAGFALFQKALSAPMPPPTVEKYDAFAADFSRPVALRQLARYKIIQVHTLEQHGDWAGALQSRLDIWQLGNDIGRDGPLVDFLNGIAIQSLGRARGADGGENLMLSQVNASLRRLESLYENRMRFASVLDGEKRFGLKMWTDMLSHPEWRDPRNFGEMTDLQKTQLAAISPTEVTRRYTAAMDRQIALARQPYSTPHQPFAQSQNTFDTLLEPDWGRLGFVVARSDTYTATWLVSLALRAHKLHKGFYPTTLQSLVPEFLHSVPMDPFSGTQPLQYSSFAGSYTLWSIGPDGVDDGGKAIPWPAGRGPAPGAALQLPPVEADSKGDFVMGQNG